VYPGWCVYQGCIPGCISLGTPPCIPGCISLGTPPCIPGLMSLTPWYTRVDVSHPMVYPGGVYARSTSPGWCICPSYLTRVVYMPVLTYPGGICRLDIPGWDTSVGVPLGWDTSVGVPLGWCMSVSVAPRVVYVRQCCSSGVYTGVSFSGGFIPGFLLRWVYSRFMLRGGLFPFYAPRWFIPWFIGLSGCVFTWFIPPGCVIPVPKGVRTGPRSRDGA